MRTGRAVRSNQALSSAVIAWRTGHALVAIGFLGSIGYVWWCAITGRRGPLLRPVVGALFAEGVLVAANRGDCPLGPLGDHIGDEVPLFELVLPPRAARAAIPVLGAVTAAGLVLLVIRSRSAEGNAGRCRAGAIAMRRLAKVAEQRLWATTRASPPDHSGTPTRFYHA